MKVLLGVATYPTDPAIYPATRAALEALQFEGEVWTAEYGDDDPKLNAVENLCNKHNRMRQAVLDGDYDALFTVEADMIIPPDALTKLVAVESDVAMGLYVSRSSRIWLCIPAIDGYKGVALNADPAAARAAWGKVIKSEGAGFGCTLIRRKVLEAITFRGDKRKRFADDWQFALDCKEQGFSMAHDLSVVCGHIIHASPAASTDAQQAAGTMGGVLWPDIDVPEMHRVEGGEVAHFGGVALPGIATYRVRRPISGPTRDYKPGETIELDAVAATILLERRGIEIMEN